MMTDQTRGSSKAKTERAGIRQILLPMPMPPHEVHVYAVETDGGWVLIDGGFPSEEAHDILRRELDRICGGAERVAAVIISHFHPDHCGLAGWVQHVSGADVYVHERDWERVRRITSGDFSGPEELGVELYSMMSAETGFTWDQLRGDIERVRIPIDRPTIVSGGERISVGHRTFELVWTPGHTEGHLCVRDIEHDLLFSGDHLLSRITPHIGVWGTSGPNALHEYEQSLALIERLDPGLALPAHEGAMEHPAERAAAIREHHQRRRLDMLSAIGGSSKTAGEISRAVFAGRGGSMQQFFALSETLAHIEALVLEGAVERVSADGDLRYRVRSTTET